MSSSKPLESWLVFFNPAQLDSRTFFELPPYILTSDNFYGLALDGGLLRAKQLNLPVHWHIGDFDSISVLPEDIEDTLSWNQLSKLADTRPDRSLLKHYSLQPDKDFLDGEVALEILKLRNIKHIIFFDYWQGRWDFSLLHFMWLLQNDWLLNKLTILIPNGYCKLISGSESFSAAKGSSFSIFPLDTMYNVELSGSLYGGESHNFVPGRGHSLSNKFESNTVTVKMKEKSRYLFFISNDGDSQ